MSKESPFKAKRFLIDLGLVLAAAALSFVLPKDALTKTVLLGYVAVIVGLIGLAMYITLYLGQRRDWPKLILLLFCILLMATFCVTLWDLAHSNYE